MRSIEERQLQFLGHILRAQGLESECLLAKINGKMANVRHRKKFMDCLTATFRGQYKVADCVHSSIGRLKWRFKTSVHFDALEGVYKCFS